MYSKGLIDGKSIKNPLVYGIVLLVTTTQQEGLSFPSVLCFQLLGFSLYKTWPVHFYSVHVSILVCLSLSSTDLG